MTGWRWVADNGRQCNLTESANPEVSYVWGSLRVDPSQNLLCVRHLLDQTLRSDTRAALSRTAMVCLAHSRIENS